MWGDTESRPGYSKTIYAQISVHSIDYKHGVYLDSFTLVGNLKQNTSVKLMTTLPLWNCYGDVCADSAKIPQGKWNWFYKVSSCFRCIPVYSQPTILGHDYSYIFSNDSIYGYQDDSVQFIDTFFIPSVCPHQFSFNRLLASSDTSKYVRFVYSYSYIGDKILQLTTNALPLLYYTQYYLADGTSLESFLPVSNPIHHMTIQENNFKVKQLRGNQIQVGYSIVRNSKVTLTMYSLSGKIVSVIFNSSQPAGDYELKSKIPLVSKGCYLLVLKKGSVIESAKFNYVN